MSDTIKQLFDEIPDFDHEDAIILLESNCEKIADQLLSVSTTTLDEEEQQEYEVANEDLMHTREQEVHMAVEAFKEWGQDKSEVNWKSYEKFYNLAIRHLKINLSKWI